MATEEIPRGQSVDLLKEKVIAPAVCSMIQKSFPDCQDLALLDIGTGDSSSAIALIQDLGKTGINLSRLGFVDKDLGIFPRAVEAIMSFSDSPEGTNPAVALIEPDPKGHFGPSLERYENIYDVATFQMVAHLMDDQADNTDTISNDETPVVSTDKANTINDSLKLSRTILCSGFFIVLFILTATGIFLVINKKYQTEQD